MQDGPDHREQQNLLRAFSAVSEGGECLILQKEDIFGTTIVLPVHLVHPLRWGFAAVAKLVQLAPSKIGECSTIRITSRNGLVHVYLAERICEVIHAH